MGSPRSCSPPAPAHSAHFYETDGELCERVAAHVAAGLDAGEPSVIYASGPHRDAIARRLRAAGIDVALALSRREIVLFDARRVLSEMLVQGHVDPTHFDRLIAEPIRERCAEHGRARAYAEMVDLLWREGELDRALALEALWNDLARRGDLELLCGYAMLEPGSDDHGERLLRIGAAHAHVTPQGVEVLEPRARTLEAEIERRKALEIALRDALEERQRIDEERSRILERERETNRAKDEFLAMLGHELRNPLAPIVTAIELMNHKLGDQAARERAVLGRQVSHLRRLVDDLLDIARITHGMIDLSRVPISIGEVLARAVEMIGPRIDQRGQELTLAPPREDLRVLGDERRLCQVLANVLGNAAKFTPAGGRIDVCAEREGAEVVVRVRDDGVGIAPELLPRVFGVFVQGQQTLDRAEGGLGIGLAIVHSIVSMHGGSVQAHSAGPGRGCEVVVRLPLHDIVAPEAAEAIAGPSPSRAARARRVLVVDDNADGAELLAFALTERGHVVEAFADGASALARARALAPDVALIDIGLPGMDGYELARRLREIPGLERLEIVAVTGYGQSEDRERSREAGLAAHLVKPIDLAALESLLSAS